MKPEDAVELYMGRIRKEWDNALLRLEKCRDKYPGHTRGLMLHYDAVSHLTQRPDGFYDGGIFPVSSFPEECAPDAMNTLAGFVERLNQGSSGQVVWFRRRGPSDWVMGPRDEEHTWPVLIWNRTGLIPGASEVRGCSLGDVVIQAALLREADRRRELHGQGFTLQPTEAQAFLWGLLRQWQKESRCP